MTASIRTLVTGRGHLAHVTPGRQRRAPARIAGRVAWALFMGIFAVTAVATIAVVAVLALAFWLLMRLDTKGQADVKRLKDPI